MWSRQKYTRHPFPCQHHCQLQGNERVHATCAGRHPEATLTPEHAFAMQQVQCRACAAHAHEVLPFHRREAVQAQHRARDQRRTPESGPDEGAAQLQLQDRVMQERVSLLKGCMPGTAQVQ